MKPYLCMHINIHNFPNRRHNGQLCKKTKRLMTTKIIARLAKVNSERIEKKIETQRWNFVLARLNSIYVNPGRNFS